MSGFLDQEIDFIKQCYTEYYFVIKQVEGAKLTIERNGEVVLFEITPDGFKCGQGTYPTFENMMMNTFEQFQETFFDILNYKLS